ncbi:hypothetical protein EU528_06350 [Candidatus Thorarchaeota archaeon]|nr:MAG: hypothetical protein EU528_06350 [Candidatus Thorarchaeota archaeon]
MSNAKQQQEENSLQTEGNQFQVTRKPKDILYTIIFAGFGIWIFSTFIFKTNMFGDLSSMCGPFLALGGFCFLFASPMKLRKAGSILGLLGSGVACYMFFIMQEMIATHVLFYSIEMAIIALGTSLLCLLISISQLCQTL